MSVEERLSELLHDPGWSLPGWPHDQALERIRRAARRQRLIVAMESAAVAVIAGASVLAAVSAVRGALPWAGGSTARGSRISQVPPVGSPGYPAAIYPAAVRPQPGQGGAALCPSPSGLQAAGRATPVRALRTLRAVRAGLTSEFRAADRSLWPALAQDRAGAAPGWPASAGRGASILRILRAAPSSVRYSGPLRAGVGELAPLRHAMAVGCGAVVMRSTWVIVSGVPGSRAQDAELLFLTRRGHVLLYGLK
jgi:hypothetical protein